MKEESWVAIGVGLIPDFSVVFRLAGLMRPPG
jgi:hypothetical protein